ncbi:hypothetical protein GQ42DRAFT_162541 [Ramicandelaber brevisporus]|nr:hypothetical protein GQ42DRAFT_162541 [Ramicandelaber brevisporus]
MEYTFVPFVVIVCLLTVLALAYSVYSFIKNRKNKALQRRAAPSTPGAGLTFGEV